MVSNKTLEIFFEDKSKTFLFSRGETKNRDCGRKVETLGQQNA